jgi:hypothetical protein
MSDAQDLNTLVGNTEPLVVAGKTIVPRTIRMKQLPKVIELVEPMKSILFKGKPDRNKTKVAETIDLTSLVVRHSHTLCLLIAEIQSPADPTVNEEWIGDLEPDQMIKLTKAVVEVNLDFFIQKVVPELSTALAGLNKGIQLKFLGGSMPLPS